MPEPTTPAPLSRRAVIAGAGVLGAGLAVAGCATEDPVTGGGASGGPGGGPAAAPGTTLGPAAEVPVGSAKIYPPQGVVVTHADTGTFAAFSTLCPHQGCQVAEVEGATVVCPCHGSTFGLDGGVVKGPAQTGLQSRGVTVENDQLTLS